MYKFWTNREEEKLKLMCSSQIPLSEISQELGRSLHSIINKARQLGCNYYQGIGKGKRSIYTLRHDYFSILTPESCYWAGFIAADGNISKINNNISIILSSRDQDHLCSLKECLCYTGKVAVSPKTARLSFFSEQMKNDLRNIFNVVPRKTFILEPPKLMDDLLIKSFLIGYIDGNGYIGIARGKYLNICICSASEVFINYIRDLFDLYYPHPKSSKPYFSRGCFNYALLGSRALRALINLLDIPTPKLYRKWIKIEEVMR